MILVFQNNETVAILVFHSNPVGVGLFSYVKNFFCSHKFAQMLATRVNKLYCIIYNYQQYNFNDIIIGLALN